MHGALSLADFERAARRILPRALFGYVAGGVETNLSVRFNGQMFDQWALRPRVLADTARRDLSTELFGHRYAAPFGVAPMGALALGWPQGDFALADAAAAEDLPFLLSGASCAPLERVRESSRTAWFQAYLPSDETMAAALVARVARAGFEVLVITVDVPVIGNRENNSRLGFSMPLRPSLQLALDAALHPKWLFGVFLRTLLKSGVPHFENYGAARSGSIFAGPPGVGGTPRVQPPLTWPNIEAVRRLWRGTLVIKGILAAEDARRAAACGADGIIVSNHGGRQLDGAVAPLSVLADVIDAAPKLIVMMDGGIRRGTHILKALALGARFVFVGRPMYYALASGGAPGARHAMKLLAEEIDRDMALMGVTRLDQLDANAVIRAGDVGLPTAGAHLP